MTFSGERLCVLALSLSLSLSLLRTPSRFISGPALGSDFALNRRALRALDSGFASTFDWKALFCHRLINFWIHQCLFLIFSSLGYVDDDVFMHLPSIPNFSCF